MSRGLARLAFTQGLSVWVLEAEDGFGEPSVHAHHAIQVTICFRGCLALATAEGSVSGRVLAVAPDIPHQLTAHGLLGFLFVEPESRTGRALRDRLFSDRPLVTLDDVAFVNRIEPLRDAIANAMEQERMLEVGWEALAALAGADRPTGPDERIQRIIDHAACHLDDPLGTAAAAAGVYLSESRLRHLFVEQTGLAYKTYLVWLRLVRAVQHYAAGSSLTEAAHAAGFADSAHFSRQFRRTFGSPASTLTRL